MTIAETATMMEMLEIAYPNYYSKKSEEFIEKAVLLWADMFTDEPYEIVLVALKSLISNHNGFPPEIADVKKEYQRIVSAATNELSNDDLWKQYTQAVANGSYGSKEAFEKLPDVLKRYCGSSNHLREMATLDTETFNTVTRGQFFKQIEIARDREKFNQQLSPGTKDLICGMVGKFKMELGDGT